MSLIFLSGAAPLDIGCFLSGSLSLSVSTGNGQVLQDMPENMCVCVCVCVVGRMIGEAVTSHPATSPFIGKTLSLSYIQMHTHSQMSATLVPG
jgi:hypothetical protein